MNLPKKWIILGFTCFGAVTALSVPLAARSDESNINLNRLSSSTNPLDALSILQQAAMQHVKSTEQRVKLHKPKCSLKSAAVRRDWWVLHCGHL